MGNVVVPNFRPVALSFMDGGSQTNGRAVMWKLSRALKAAGWIYKSSGNGNTGAGTGKDTTGAYASDAWNGYGLQITGQSGTTANVSSVTTGVTTITGLTGMTASSVGHVLQLKGAFTSTNNGFFKIVTFTSASTVGILAALTTGDTHNNAINWVEYDGTYTNGNGTAASVTTFSNNRIITVTGLTGMTPLSTQRWLSLSGAASGGNNGTFKILKWISANSVTIINPSGVATDANNGTITWKELDPLQEQYINFVTSMWINMQGPSTLRVPLTAQSTGTFIRGETVTQNFTGASGEILGYQFDTVASTGHLIVMPQINGNGAGVQGWDGTHSITGDNSGASANPSATPVEFVREIVIFQSTNIGSVASLQCVDSVGESASRFSVLAGAAGCTATVAPGGGGTGNAFPAPGTYTFLGDSSTTTATVFGNNTATQYNQAQIMCTDATYDGYRSADGSWAAIISVLPNTATTIGTTSSCTGYVWTRVDNQEDGDVDPYVMYCPQQTALYSATRQSANSVYSNSEQFNAATTPQLGTETWQNHLFRGWRRRGFPSTDAFQGFGGANICSLFNTTGTFSGSATGVQAFTTWDGPKIATRGNTPNTEPLWVISAQTGSLKMRKGTCRWIRLVAEGSTFDLYNGGTWIQCSNSYPAFIVGMWDGISTPMR